MTSTPLKKNTLKEKQQGYQWKEFGSILRFQNIFFNAKIVQRIWLSKSVWLSFEILHYTERNAFHRLYKTWYKLKNDYLSDIIYMQLYDLDFFFMNIYVTDTFSTHIHWGKWTQVTLQLFWCPRHWWRRYYYD